MKTKRRVNLETLLETDWAVLPGTLTRIVDVVRQAPASGAVPAGDVVALNGTHDGPPRMGGVAVIPVYGVIEHRSDWMMEYFGGCSVDGLREDLAAALADQTVAAIVLDIDSPGGSIAGITEFCAELRAARGGAKPIVAVANTMAASAAYWIACQADELVVTPSGQVGSIGVYAVHQDISRMIDALGVTVTLVSAGEHKTDGNEYAPLSDSAREDIQSRVDATYQQFVADVAAGRRVTTGKVEADFGGGRVFMARAALSLGMVDRVEALGQTIQRLGTSGGRKRAMSADEGGPEILAGGDPSARNDPPDPNLPPFGERLAALAADAEGLVSHARERSRLRAKEGRPAFSTSIEQSLRAIRGAIDGLLALDDPDPSVLPVEPVHPTPPAPSTPPPAAPVQRRFQSREDWLHHLEASAPR